MQLFLTWIHGHSKVLGNKLADELVRKGYNTCLGLPASSVRKVIKGWLLMRTRTKSKEF